MKPYLISEIFGPTLQGEGALCGQVSHFIRVSGCAWRCSWCDSMHAVDPKQIHKKSRKLTADQVIKEVIDLPPSPWITLTGGDPCLYDLYPIAGQLKFGGYKIAVETQGAFYKHWLQVCDLITCSPKPPSSKMDNKVNMNVLREYSEKLKDRLVFKVVVFTNADLEFITKLYPEFLQHKWFISVGTYPEDNRHNILERFRGISEKVLVNPILKNMTVFPQMHVLLWGHALGR